MPKEAKAKKEPKAASKKEAKEPKAARAPSAYNEFMKDEIAKVKKANPELGHKEAFKIAAANWKTSKDNPKAAA